MAAAAWRRQHGIAPAAQNVATAPGAVMYGVAWPVCAPKANESDDVKPAWRAIALKSRHRSLRYQKDMAKRKMYAEEKRHHR